MAIIKSKKEGNMFKLLEAVSTAMYDLLRWKLNIKIVMTGVVVTLLWSILGWLLWPFLYGVGSSIMNLLPFAMLRSDGAYIFIALVWALGTMVTFALTMMFFGEIFARRISGARYTRFLPLMIVGISVFWAVIVAMMFGKLYQVFERILTSLPYEFTEKGVAGVIVIYLLYNAILVTMIALASLRSKYILEPLRLKYYPSQSETGDTEDTFMATVRDIAIFVGISAIAFPLLFIPILNIVIQLGLYIWLYKDMFGRDVCALYCDLNEKRSAKNDRWEPWTVAVLASFMSFIPFISFFAPYFGEVTMFHLVMKVKESQED